MKYYLFIYLFIYSLNSCKDATTSTKVIEEVVIEDSLTSINTLSKEYARQNIIQYDTLSIEQAKFNNKPLYYKHLSLIKTKIDSTKNHNWECGNPFGWEGEILESKYINGAEYVSNNDTDEGFLIAAELGKDDNFLTLYIDSKIIKITNETNVNEIEELFPNSETIKLPNNFYTRISFNRTVPENSWAFYYNNKGNLIRFELYWLLC